jgi:hypothetical protein
MPTHNSADLNPYFESGEPSGETSNDIRCSYSGSVLRRLEMRVAAGHLDDGKPIVCSDAPQHAMNVVFYGLLR